MTALALSDFSRRVALLSFVLVLGCGGSSSPDTTSGEGSSTSGGSTPTGTTGPQPPDPRTEHDLEPLRPAAVQSTLAALDRVPLDSEAYARGAVAFADTDVAGMTLLWGQVYRILDSHGRKTAEVTEAMARVIREKIAVRTGASGPELDLRFAPGAMPIISTRDGRYYAPLAHLYEHSMSNSTTIASAQRDTFEGASQVFAAELGVICRSGAPVLDDSLYAFLCALDAAGHRAVYSHWVIGPAFGAAFEQYSAANGPAIERLLNFFVMHPYEPTRPTRPDDLYPVRPRGN